MGFLTPVDRRDGARHSRAGYPNPSGCLRDNELGSVRFDSTRTDLRHRKPLETEAQRRQLTALAQLVRAFEPNGAESLAQKLIKEFGSLGQVLAAASWKIAQFTGNDLLAATLSAARAAVLEGLQEDFCRFPIDLRDPKLLVYLKAQMQGEEEYLHAIFLDNQQRYISDERVASGDWTNVAIRLRPLFRRTMEIGAAKLVLCHNHPSGNPTPSQADIIFTNEVQKVARSLGIELLDHLIVSGKSVFSMRTAGLVA